VRRSPRRRKAAIAVVLASALVVAAIAFIPALRTATAMTALSIVLRQSYGYDLRSGAAHIRSDAIEIDGLEIDDALGSPVFSADRITASIDPRAWLGRSDRYFGIRSIAVNAPDLRIIRRADGSYDLSPLFANRAQTAPPPEPPFRFTLKIDDGSIEFEDPAAPSPAGRAFVVSSIAAAGSFDQRGVTRLRGGGDYIGSGRRSQLDLAYFDDAPARFARVTLTGDGIELAPIVDGVAPTKAFVVESGSLDSALLSAYAIDGDPAAGPQWHLSGSGRIVDGAFRVEPLVAPVTGVAGPLAFAGGALDTTGLSGMLEGRSVAIGGDARLVGGTRLDLSIAGEQSLVDLKRAFAFSQRLDVRGIADIALRIDGPPARLDVAGLFSAPAGVSYAGIPVDDPGGTLYYADGHLTVPSASGGYDGGDVSGSGDIVLGAPGPTAQVDLIATMPASRLPVAANVNPLGRARSLVELDGPLASLQGWAYADLVGGNGISARTAIYAGPTRFAVGPALVQDPSGGELMLRGAIDRSARIRTVEGDAIARDMPLHLVSAARALPGIDGASPISLPQATGSIDGVAIVRGDERAPAVGVDASAEGLVVSGARLGRVAVQASGIGTEVRIARASIDGADAEVNATGVAAVFPRSRSYAAVLDGDGTVELAALAGAMPWSHAAGSATGTFSAALSGGRFTVAVSATGHEAKVEGVSVKSLEASVGGGGGGTTDLYAGHVGLPGGSLEAIGVVPAARRRDGDLQIWTDGLDLRALRPLGFPVDRGDAVAVARVSGGGDRPDIAGTAILQDGGIGRLPLSGDVDVDYADDRLVAKDGDVSIGGSFAHVSGVVSGIGPGLSTKRAGLSLRASMREGDLGSLADRFLPSNIDVEGTVAARLRVRGTIGAPAIDGSVAADSGSLQGVAFEDLDGSVAVSSGSVRIARGSVAFASSRFAFSGSLSQAALHLRASTRDVDLADFNDFFDGYDTLEGAGSGDIAFESTRTGVLASGEMSVTRASVVGFPLGAVDADFASRGDQLLAHMRQSGTAGSSDLAGTVTFGPRRSALPDLASARYDVHGSMRGVDVGQVAPLIGRESIGLTGLLDADGSLRGGLRAPTGHVDFNLRGGHIGKVAIETARGSIDTDGKTTTLAHATIDLPFATVNGGGSFGPGKRVAASFSIAASDIGTLFGILGHPGIASGIGSASVSVAGTSSAPRVTTTILTGRGSAYGVPVDRVTGVVTYGPGEVDIGNAEVDLGGGRGAFTIGGTLPLQLEPFGLGPKDRPIDLVLAAHAVDLSALSGLTSRYLSMSGTLDAEGAVTGTAGRPQIAGAAHLRHAGASSPRETVDAQNVGADLSFDRDTLTLTRLTGNLGSGSFNGTGAVHIVPAAGLLKVASISYWSRLDLHDVDLSVPDWVSGSVNGTLRLTKSGSTPFLSGDATLDDGTVPFSAIYELASGYGSGPAPDNGPIPGVPDVRPGHIVVYGGPVFGGGPVQVRSGAIGTVAPPPVRVLPSVDLDVNAGAGRSVRVHGGAIDLTAGGGLLIGGNLRSPTLAGTFTSTRGQIGYFDTNFRLVRGTVTFDPAEGLLPTLDVKAITDLSGAEITLTVTGRVDNLQTDLSSDPSMTRDAIVAILLHAPQLNSVIGASPNGAQSALYAEAQSYFNAQLTRSLLFPVESMIAQTINVEQISLIYDQENRVDVEIRKLITPTVFAIYRSSLNIPVTQTEGVAYSLRDYADLEILQTQSPTGLEESVLNLRITFH
jgi:hypothetical protein